MEQKLLQLLKLADTLNNKQNNVFAKIEYYANDNKKLEITLKDKKDYSTIMIIEMYIDKMSNQTIQLAIDLLKKYIGGAYNE